MHGGEALEESRGLQKGRAGECQARGKLTRFGLSSPRHPHLLRRKPCYSRSRSLLGVSYSLLFSPHLQYDEAGADLIRALMKSGVEVDFREKCENLLQWAFQSVSDSISRESEFRLLLNLLCPEYDQCIGQETAREGGEGKGGGGQAREAKGGGEGGRKGGGGA